MEKRWLAVAAVPPSSAGLPGAEATTAHEGPWNPLGATEANTPESGQEGGDEAGGPGTTPVTPTLLCLHRLDNVHGSRVEPSETARMNSMDRHIQQTNDRLQCIKQVGVWPGLAPPPLVARPAGEGRAGEAGRAVGLLYTVWLSTQGAGWR